MKPYFLTLLLIASFSLSKAQFETSTWTNPTGEYSATSAGLCGGCTLTGLSNIADADMTNSATLTIPAGALYTATLRAKLPHMSPGNSYAGFLITTNTLIGVLPIVTLTTYKNNIAQETVTGSGSLLSVMSSTTGFVCGQTNASLPYDEVGITFTSFVVSLGMIANVYYAYGGVASCPTLSTVLPIGFSNVDLITPQGIPALKWTMQEGNAAWYSIERSTDAQHFIETGRVNAESSLDNQNYSYTDYNAPDSNSWYRIGAHSADGKVGYSKVLQYTPAVAAGAAVRIFPNPVADHFTIQAAGFSGNGMVEIFSLQGQLVEKKMTNIPGVGGSVSVELTHPLTPGIYVVQLTDAASNNQWRSKMVSR